MASQDPFPLMPPKSTELRLMHFDEYVYTGDNTTILYKLVDALCGTVGAGQLVNEIFLARMAGALETIYFNDLDYIFGRVSFLVRSPAESYSYNPQIDMLTSDQWDEVRVKDAWYRARIRDFFTACTMGGTPDGIRMTVQAAVATDADIYEVWRYRDNFGLTEDLGRSPITEMWAAVDLSTGQQEVFTTHADATGGGLRPGPGHLGGAAGERPQRGGDQAAQGHPGPRRAAAAARHAGQGRPDRDGHHRGPQRAGGDEPGAGERGRCRLHLLRDPADGHRHPGAGHLPAARAAAD